MRRFSSSGREDVDTSNTTSTRDAVTFACWPPGPDERLVRRVTSDSGIVTPGRISIGSSMQSR
jgi:hypothetical protein